MAQPSAMPSRHFSRPSMAPAKAPENFPIEAIATSPTGQQRDLAVFRMVRSADRPDMPKKMGMKKAVIMPRNWP